MLNIYRVFVMHVILEKEHNKKEQNVEVRGQF